MDNWIYKINNDNMYYPSSQDTADLYATRKGIEAKLAEPYPGIDNPVAWV
jgi:hypothetical protein